MRISAVVPTYDRKELLEECLQALLRQTRPLDEIIVVDNASSDGTEEMIKERFRSQITYLRLSENTGSAGGFCEGMKLAHDHGHDWIWCMDNDAVPLEDTLEKLLEAEYRSEHPVVAKVCSRLDPQSASRYRGGDLLDLKLRQAVNMSQTDWEGKTLSIDLAHWGGLLVSSEVAHRAGFPNPGLFAWYDDCIFSLELKRFGRILHVGTASLFHSCNTSRYVNRSGHLRLVAQQYWKEYYLFRNGFLFKSIAFGKWRTFIEFVSAYLRMLLAILVLDDFKFYRMRILTQALFDALTGKLGRRVDPQDFQKRFGPAACSHDNLRHKPRSNLLPT